MLGFAYFVSLACGVQDFQSLGQLSDSGADTRVPADPGSASGDWGTTALPGTTGDPSADPSGEVGDGPATGVDVSGEGDPGGESMGTQGDESSEDTGPSDSTESSGTESGMTEESSDEETLGTDDTDDTDDTEATEDTGDTGPIPEIPNPLDDYLEDRLPPHFRAFSAHDNTPRDNPNTNPGALLGRILFYDRRLSADGQRRCADCHVQQRGFSGPEVIAQPLGDGLVVRRNTPALVNLRWVPQRAGDVQGVEPGGFGWEGRVATLEAYVVETLGHPAKMANDDPDALLARLEGTVFYPRLFAAAFRDGEISGRNVAAALAQFLRAMVSYRSPWDEALRDAWASPTDIDLRALMAGGLPVEAIEGFEVFRKLRCGECHNSLGLETRPGFHNIGLDLESRDPGRMHVTGNEIDRGRFRPPDLRNVSLAGPYMHDGRMERMADVLTHYAGGYQTPRNLDDRVREMPKLEVEQLERLAAFLKTLTDRSYLSDPRFADPFP